MMTVEEFSSLRKKALNTEYVLDVDGVTKTVVLTDAKREEKKANSKNCKTLYLAKVDGVQYKEYYNIKDLCKRIAGKAAKGHTLQDDATKDRNLTPLSNFTDDANLRQAQNEYNRYLAYKQAVFDLEQRYGFNATQDGIYQVCNAAVVLSVEDARKQHLFAVCKRYKAQVQNYINNLQKDVDNKEAVLTEWTKANILDLIKGSKAAQKKALELETAVQTAKITLANESSRKFFTDDDIRRRYGF